MNKFFFNVFAFLLCATISEAQTIKIWPNVKKGTGVTYGGDVKLTLFRITDYDLVNQKFVSLGLDVTRVPIIAHWGASDNRYDSIKSYVNSAKNAGLNIFASIANTNGQFKPNGDLDDAHNGDKFPLWMKCTGAGGTQACTSSETGTYGIKLPRYKSYLEDVVVNSIGNVSWVGPWNEDNVTLNDYTQLDWGKSIVGSELWSLSASDEEMNQIGSGIDIGGAHNYDNNSNLLLAYTDWKNFIDAGGDWFSESTLFGQSTAKGIAHMLPAISAGIKKIIIYQTVPRIITVTGGEAAAYSATAELIAYSKGKGAACQVETNNQKYVAAAFTSGSDLILHVCNIDSIQKTIYVNLQDYVVSTTETPSVAKFGGTTASVTFANQGAQVKVLLSANTYARIILKGLATNARLIQPASEEQNNLIPGLYPNPAKRGSSIIIDLPADDLNFSHLQLTNISGQTTYRYDNTVTGSNQLTIPAHISAGVYQLIIHTRKHVYSKKIRIQ